MTEGDDGVKRVTTPISILSRTSIIIFSFFSKGGASFIISKMAESLGGKRSEHAKVNYYEPFPHLESDNGTVCYE